MSELLNLEPKRVFYYFEKICSIPHGSGNMRGISDFCVAFAKEHNLEYARDNADNIVVYKSATKGYESKEPVILQGHLDMVCQKEEGYEIDFVNDAIKPYVEGDFVKAKGTTLGADNGIAVAIILAILESGSYNHPPIEAVFTVDEEIGLLGAGALDCSLLKGKTMINIDSEEDDTVTVSCAGGRNFSATIPVERVKKAGDRVSVVLRGLQGGHSGVEIHKGRVNANILAGRVINHFAGDRSVNLISINGGDKTNAITNHCEMEFLVEDVEEFTAQLNTYLELIKGEISARESGFCYDVCVSDMAHTLVLPDDLKKQLAVVLVSSPQGVVEMSAEIEGLVETSMNLGVIKTTENELLFKYSFRSNKKTAIDFLEEKMNSIFSNIPCEIEISGGYPSWEYKADSRLRDLYCDCYKTYFGKDAKIEAIHAGLECGVFDSKIDNLDCISVGPTMFDVHTFNEKLSVSSTNNLFNVIVDVLEKM